MNDTIVAISTSLGVGAISIIRLSGKDAIKIVNKVFKGKNLAEVETHTINYGFIMDNDKKVDEVLVSVMKSPKTYTYEDVVEINCHGGIAASNKVLELMLINGARLAEPGEFTKRAFLNGRIDLTQADGIMNLIESKTEKTRTLSMSQLSGEVSNLIRELREQLISIISNIEVNIDYPEYEDIEILTNNKILPEIKQFSNKLNKIIESSEDGRLIQEGIKVGIIGRPNVGKSSLLNTLLDTNKAIVTDIPGTTRDIVEGSIILKGIILNFLDTAGIRKTDNIVEQLGVTKSLDIINEADLIILVLNNNEKLSDGDKELLKLIENKKHIIVVNKIDLEKKLQIDKEVIKISIKDNVGIDKLKEEVIKIFNLDELETKDLTYLTNARSVSLLKEALSLIDNSINEIENNNPIDIVEIDLKTAWEKLGEIIGETYTDELLDNLFNKFCLGK